MTDDGERPGFGPRAAELDDPGMDQAHTFEGKENARRALREYAAAVWELDAGRNALILGAQASGLSDSEIQALSGVARSTFSKLALPVAPIVAQETRHAYATLLIHRAKRLAGLGSASTDRYERAYLSAYVEVTGKEAEGWLPGYGAAHDSPYGDRLVHRSIQLRAQVRRTRAYRAAYPISKVTRGMGPGWAEQVGGEEDGRIDAQERIAAELALLRHGGPAVLDSLFLPEELAEVPPVDPNRQRIVFRGDQAVYLDADGREIEAS